MVHRVLGVVALFTGVAKMIAAGPSPIPSWALTCIAMIEVAIGLTLLIRPVWWGAATVFMIAMAGGCYSLVYQRTACGCLGTWMTLSWRQHVVLAAAVGSLALWTLWRTARTAGCRLESTVSRAVE